MKNKSLILLLLTMWGCSLLWFYRYTQQYVSAINTQWQQLSQANAGLNDQVVALQRRVEPATDTNNALSVNSTSASTVPSSTVSSQTATQRRQTSTQSQQHLPKVQNIAKNQDLSHSKALLKAQLQLVQFALAQQQYVYALEQLNIMQRELPQQVLADTLQKSLAQSLVADQVRIQTYFEHTQQQQGKLLSVLSQLDRQLQQIMQHTPQSVPQNHAWWQNWLNLERSRNDAPALHNRQQIYQEVQWRLQLAQQAQLQGQDVLYKQQLVLAQDLLARVPDMASRRLQQRLNDLQIQARLSMPELQSMALLR